MTSFFTKKATKLPEPTTEEAPKNVATAQAPFLAKPINGEKAQIKIHNNSIPPKSAEVTKADTPSESFLQPILGTAAAKAACLSERETVNKTPINDTNEAVITTPPNGQEINGGSKIRQSTDNECGGTLKLDSQQKVEKISMKSQPAFVDDVNYVDEVAKKLLETFGEPRITKSDESPGKASETSSFLSLLETGKSTLKNTVDAVTAISSNVQEAMAELKSNILPGKIDTATDIPVSIQDPLGSGNYEFLKSDVKKLATDFIVTEKAEEVTAIEPTLPDIKDDFEILTFVRAGKDTLSDKMSKSGTYVSQRVSNNNLVKFDSTGDKRDETAVTTSEKKLEESIKEDKKTFGVLRAESKVDTKVKDNESGKITQTVPENKTNTNATNANAKADKIVSPPEKKLVETKNEEQTKFDNVLIAETKDDPKVTRSVLAMSKPENFSDNVSYKEINSTVVRKIGQDELKEEEETKFDDILKAETKDDLKGTRSELAVSKTENISENVSYKGNNSTDVPKTGRDELKEDNIKEELGNKLKKQHQSRGKDFIDEDFSLEKALFKYAKEMLRNPKIKEEEEDLEQRTQYYLQSGFYQWKKASKISLNAKFFENEPTPRDVGPGRLGSDWFAAALASVAQNPQLLLQVVPQNFEEFDGAFRFRFWREDEWHEVVVDDLIPISSNNSPTPDIFWSLLLEKAYAKFYGGYDAVLTGSADIALTDLTGGIVEKIIVRSTKNDLYPTMMDALSTLSPMTASADTSTGRQTCAVMGVATTPIQHSGKSQRLVKVRAFSDGKSWPAFLAYHSLHGAEQMVKEAIDANNNAEFTIRFEDFVEFFDEIQIARYFKEQKSSWTEMKFDGVFGLIEPISSLQFSEKMCLAQLQVPVYEFNVPTSVDTKVDRSTKVLIDIARKEVGSIFGNTIGFTLIKVDGGKEDVLGEVHSNRRQASSNFQLKPGRYFIVPSTDATYTNTSFQIRILLQN